MSIEDDLDPEISKPDEPAPSTKFITGNELAKKTQFSHRFSQLQRLINEHKWQSAAVLLIVISLISVSVGALITHPNSSEPPLTGNISTDQGQTVSPDAKADKDSKSSDSTSKPGTSAGSSSTSAGSSTSHTNTAVSFTTPIGYVGGSLTTNAIDGYNVVGGEKFWTFVGKNFGGYGGGTVTAWASGISAGNNNEYWQAFNNKLSASAAKGTTKFVWFELLSHGNESDSTLYNGAVAVINEIRDRIPGVSIYVSGMNGYNPAGFCNGVTVEVPTQMNALAKRLASEGKAVQGPVMANLTPSQVKDVHDGGCHANDVGKPILGNNLLSFFK